MPVGPNGGRFSTRKLAHDVEVSVVDGRAAPVGEVRLGGGDFATHCLPTRHASVRALHRPVGLIRGRHFDPALLRHGVHGQAALPERELEADRSALNGAEGGQR